MKKALLEFLQAHPRHVWKPREIAKFLKIPPNNKKDLRNLLRDLEEDRVLSRHRGGGYTLRGKVPTVQGQLKMHPDGYGFVIPEERGEKDIFIPERYMGEALPNDTVEASFRSREDGRREGRIEKVVKRGREIWIGTLLKKGHHFEVEIKDAVRPLTVFIPPDDRNGAKPGDLVATKITSFSRGLSDCRGVIVKALGDPFDPKTEMEAILVKYHVRRDYPSEVLQEASRLPGVISEEEITRRVDLRSKPIITIDGITARDFDDAVWVEKKGKFYHLYVSIADVAAYVKMGSPLDQEALERGTSVYLPDFAVAMLPERLSNDLCSLRPGEDRLTLTCEIICDGEGVPREASYYESVIRSQKRGTYDEVQAYFDGVRFADEVYVPAVRDSLNLMKELATKMISNRVKRGGIDFDLPEPQFVFNAQGEISAIVRSKRFFSHRLIEEFMIAANVAVGELFTQKGLPLLYRIHDRPDNEKMAAFGETIKALGMRRPPLPINEPKELLPILDMLKKHPMESFLHQILLRSMKQAVYSAENIGHFGLALPNYAHFTSPIRRYPDLTVHRQLKSLLMRTRGGEVRLKLGTKLKGERGARLKDDALAYSFDMLESVGRQASQKEREAMEAERETVDFKKSLFMREHQGDCFFGTIRRIAKFGVFVELEPHFTEGLLPVKAMKDDYYVYDEKHLKFVGRKKKKVYKVGDKIRVRVEEVNVGERKINLVPA